MKIFLACKAVKYTNYWNLEKKNRLEQLKTEVGYLVHILSEVVGTVPEIFFFPIFAFVHRSLT